MNLLKVPTKAEVEEVMSLRLWVLIGKLYINLLTENDADAWR